MEITAKRHRVSRQRHAANFETLVDASANFWLILGIMVAIANLFSDSVLWWRLLVSIVMLFGFWLQWLLLRCVAEHLRLQKKIAGLPYSGTISSNKHEFVWNCGNCGQLLYTDTRCEFCGAKIVGDAEG
ncbi:MAG: hypothetical protein AAF958_18975 [Planctomycetota bacterium]